MIAVVTWLLSWILQRALMRAIRGKEGGRKAAISSGKQAHKTNIWWWQTVKLRKVNVKNRRSAVSHCYFCMIIPRCWCILSSSLSVYHTIQYENEKLNLRRVIYIDALFIHIKKGLQKRLKYSSNIFFIHLIPRAFESWLVTKATKLECYSWQLSTAKCLIVSESYGSP